MYALIARYLEQNPEIIVVQTYIDNGATGTNFHRPGFQQMLSDIEAGLINCVIVKDLSRLGRNVIDTGYYIERYFPTQGVRFIAVNDRYDSSSPDHAHDGISFIPPLSSGGRHALSPPHRRNTGHPPPVLCSVPRPV